jgi:hypothetical protein
MNRRESNWKNMWNGQTMNAKCLLGFHVWSGCKCTRCGNIRTEGHDWNNDCEKCSTCGTSIQDAHQWDGCTCKSCGKKRDQCHKWQDCKCIVCGRTRNTDHDWHNGVCNTCGKINPLGPLQTLCKSAPEPEPLNWRQLGDGLYRMPIYPAWLRDTWSINSYALDNSDILAVIEALYPLIESGNDEMRLYALVVLINFKDKIPTNSHLVDLLISCLESGKPLVRYNAIKVLARLRDLRVVPRLEALAHSDPDKEVREIALECIKYIGAKSTLIPPDLPPIPLSVIREMTDAQRLSLLREIVVAIDDASKRPGHLNTDEKRRQTARYIGEVLNELGGFRLMQKTLTDDMGWMPGCRTVETYWDGIGDWLG